MNSKHTNKKVQEGKSKGKNVLLFFSLIILLVFAAALSFAQISLHKINEGSTEVYSDQQLICSWVLNETLYSNVTWYKNGVINTTQTNILCTESLPCSTSGDGNIPASFTVRSQNWICSVEYNNGTGQDIHNATVSIINSPPTSPRTYWQNGTEIVNITVQIAEDNTTTFIVNSTDGDGDTITYTINDTIYCSINSTGALMCSPTAESHVGIKNIKIKSEDSEGATLGYVTTLTLNVTPVNDAPVVVLTNKTVYEYAALNYTITGTDAENNTPFNFSISGWSSIIIVPASNTSAIIKFNNSGTDIAAYADRGNHTINVTIIDSLGANSTSSFNLQVISVNTPPNLSFIPNQTGIQGGNLLFYINATDINNDTLTFYINDSLYNITTINNTYNDSGVTYAIGLINTTSLTNDHVIHTSIKITVFDTKENTSQNVVFNITNTNDAPVIYNISNYATNTLNNSNITNLTAYSGVVFSYRVNATDVDMLTYENDVITFTTNDSRFIINSSTGIINFTKNDSFLGNHSFVVTVTDSDGLTFNTTANITIYANTNPYFNESLQDFVCYEYDSINYPFNCTYNLSFYAKESDSGDYVASYSTNLDSYNLTSSFVVNSTTGIIRLTGDQDDIGEYNISVTITDSRGGENTTTLRLNITNTNNPPYLDAITFPKIIVGYTQLILITASDLDLDITSTYENLTFNQSISGSNSTLFSVVKYPNSSTTAYISFTPLSSDSGNYSTTISVSDYYNNKSSRQINFTVYNQTTTPTISNITPYGTYYYNGSLVTSNLINISWIRANSTNFPNKQTNITIYENSSYIFNQTSYADNTSYTNNLSYHWLLNGTQISSNSFLNRTYAFFSAGAYNITFIAEDEFYNNKSFSWYVKVLDVNRIPVLLNSLSNLSVDGTTTYSGYMTNYNSITRFIDPDDDLNSDDVISGNESSTMTYNASVCSFATLTFIGTDLKVTPSSTGVCYVNFTAHDALNSSMYTLSNTVKINITRISNDTETQIVYVTIGGGSSTRTVSIPVPQDVEKPVPLKIVVPKSVSIYKNSTVSITILLNNTWNETLEGVTLSAQTNASNVSFYFSKTYFSRIYSDNPEIVTLTMVNYKSEGHYEIEIIGNVTNPNYQDSAVIFINSADVQSEKEEFEVKIGFARDLLSSNPECQELNELLNEAKKELANNNFEKTAKLIDGVVSGCKYLVNNAKNNVESPQREFIKLLKWNKKYTDYLIIAAFSVMLIAGLFYVFKKETPDEKFD